MLDQIIYLPYTKEALKDLPSTFGIYVFSKDGIPVYIGKSVNIKARVLSHIENAKKDPKEAAIIENTTNIGYFVTDSEFKALILESRLIQTNKPAYNVRWMDDKSYLYIKVTIADEYPKVLLSRREEDEKSRYFGPFPSVRTCQDILKAIRRVIPFCTQKRVTKRTCFYSKIGQCDPCPNEIENLQDHVLKAQLKKIYRRNIRRVLKILEGQTEDIMKQLYDQIKELSSEEKYEEALELRNKVLRLEEFFHGRVLKRGEDEQFNQSEESLEKLLTLLNQFIPELTVLDRIECYDVSNTSQQDATASMVVMTNGQIDKTQYRKFKIKDLTSQSDFEMMYEVLHRRFKNKWPEPRLLVVDGGKPQVRVAQKVLQELEKTIPLIGIAKNPDRLIISDELMRTIRPQLNHRGFNLIRALRDESHRFAKKYHVSLRSKKMV